MKTKEDITAAIPGLKNFDYALPHKFVVEFEETTNINPVPHFVWNYTNSLFGRPFPITELGKAALNLYFYRRGEQNHEQGHVEQSLKETSESLHKDSKTSS